MNVTQVKECFSTSAYRAELSVVYYTRAQSIFCRCVYLAEIGTFHNSMPISISQWHKSHVTCLQASSSQLKLCMFV